MFERRPYLPIVTIYATAVAGISLAQIGIISSITSLVVLISEIPSGYLADKFGHKKSLLFGSFVMTISPLIYIFYPNFFGACLAMVLFWFGVSFHSGTQQAFIHETLLALKRPADFILISSQERRYAMTGNIILVALVPLTYQISPLLPFVLGFVIHLGAFISYTLMTTPKKIFLPIQENLNNNFLDLLIKIKKRKELLLFIFFGIIGASFIVLAIFRELYFQEINVPLKLFGFIFSLTGVVSIFFTFFMPHLNFKKIKPATFYFFDALFIILMFILIGLTHQIILGIILFIFTSAYRRVRSIIFHYHLLKNCPSSQLKATYLSVFSFFSALGKIFLSLLLGFLIKYSDLNGGYLFFGIILLIVALPLYLIIYNKSFLKSS